MVFKGDVIIGPMIIAVHLKILKKKKYIFLKISEKEKKRKTRLKSVSVPKTAP